MLALLRYWQVAVGAVLGAVLMFTYATAVLEPRARQEGRADERADALARSMEIIQERSRTDADVRNLDAASLCRELGGVFTDNRCE